MKRLVVRDDEGATRKLYVLSRRAVSSRWREHRRELVGGLDECAVHDTYAFVIEGLE